DGGPVRPAGHTARLRDARGARARSRARARRAVVRLAGRRPVAGRGRARAEHLARRGRALSEPPVFRVGSELAWRELAVGDGVETVAIGRGAERIPVRGRELALVLDAARWRYDIPHWRWTKGFAEAPAGFERP